jgi:hypothetical protein
MLHISCYCGRVTGTCTALSRNMRLPLCVTSMTWLSSVEAAAPLPSQAKSSQLITSSTLHHEAIGKCIRPIWHSINSAYHGNRNDLIYSSKLWMSGPQLKKTKSLQDVCWKFSTVCTNECVPAENVNYIQQNDGNWCGPITHINPFQSNFSAYRILLSSFVLGRKEVGGLLVIILQF